MFGADLRSLALLRVALAALVLCDVGLRARDLTVFYGDAGVLPRATYLELVGEGWGWSLHLLSGAGWVQAGLFVVAGLAALAMLVGWRTRAATVVTWVLLCSVQQRNPLLEQGGDILLRVVLFWGMFLPLGARASVDRARARASARGGHGAGDGEAVRVLSVATVALVVQLVLVYWMTALWKDSAAWRTEGSALYWALQIDQYVSGLGRWLRGYPGALTVLSLVVFWFEVVGPCLLLSPWRTGVLRTVAVAGFVALHVGVWLCLDIGLFPFVSAFVMVGLLPSWFWDDGVPRLGAALRRVERGVAARVRGRAGAPAAARLPRWAEVLCAGCLVYVVWWNVADLPGAPVGLPGRLRFVAQVTRLEQRWDMFAPAPMRNDGWMVIVGRLGDGREVDLMRGARALSWEAPAQRGYANQRWRRYLMNLVAPARRGYRGPYARWLCRRWRAAGVGSLELVFMRERTMPPGQAPEVTRLPLWRETCAPARARENGGKGG